MDSSNLILPNLYLSLLAFQGVEILWGKGVTRTLSPGVRQAGPQKVCAGEVRTSTLWRGDLCWDALCVCLESQVWRQGALGRSAKGI